LASGNEIFYSTYLIYGYVFMVDTTSRIWLATVKRTRVLTVITIRQIVRLFSIQRLLGETTP
jgi:hypothetical protein